MRWFALVLLLCPLPAFSQRQIAFPIEMINIEGNHAHSREQILAAAGLRVGQKVTAREIDAARQRLLATGVFDSVGFKYGPAPGAKGYLITFEVVESGPLLPLEFEDLPAQPAEMIAALRQADPMFTPEIPATPEILARYTKILQQFLAARHYTEAIAGRLKPDEAGRLAVVFRPAAAPPAVARVTFTGNQVLPSSALENAINAVAIGMPYEEARFRTLLNSQVRPLYDARGRVRVSFPEIHTEKDPDVAGVVVRVNVNEGASYSLRKVEVDGSGLPEREALQTGNFKTGDLFNIEQIHAGVARIEQRLRAGGYMHVESRLERSIDDKAKTVDLAIHINRGPQYRFGKLTIQGLDLITEPAIRKMWTLKEGQPYDAAYPDYFLKRVREDGVLDNLGETKAVQQPDDQAHTVDVTLIFKGEPPKPKRPRW